MGRRQRPGWGWADVGALRVRDLEGMFEPEPDDVDPTDPDSPAGKDG